MIPELLGAAAGVTGLCVLLAVGLLLGGLAAAACWLVKGTVRLICAPFRLAMWLGIILLALALLAGAC